MTEPILTLKEILNNQATDEDHSVQILQWIARYFKNEKREKRAFSLEVLAKEINSQLAGVTVSALTLLKIKQLHIKYQELVDTESLDPPPNKHIFERNINASTGLKLFIDGMIVAITTDEGLQEDLTTKLCTTYDNYPEELYYDTHLLSMMTSTIREASGDTHNNQNQAAYELAKADDIKKGIRKNLCQLCDDYVDHLKKQGASEKTLNKIGSIANLKKSLYMELSFSLLPPKVLREFIENNEQQALSDLLDEESKKTYNAYLDGQKPWTHEIRLPSGLVELIEKLPEKEKQKIPLLSESIQNSKNKCKLTVVKRSLINNQVLIAKHRHWLSRVLGWLTLGLISSHGKKLAGNCLKILSTLPPCHVRKRRPLALRPSIFKRHPLQPLFVKNKQSTKKSGEEKMKLPKTRNNKELFAC